MKCKYCNIQISSATKTCPLCHETLSEVDTSLTTSFPDRAPVRPRRVAIDKAFTIYTFSASVIFLLCLTVNMMLDSSFFWCGIVGAVLGYGMFLIKNTILSTISVGQKIFWQGSYLIFILWTIQHLTKSGNWLWAFGLPFVCIFAVLSIVITMLCFHRFAKSYFLSVFALSLPCFIPLVLYALNVYDILWPSVTAATVGSVAILFVTIFGKSTLFPEFVKKFHF